MGQFAGFSLHDAITHWRPSNEVNDSVDYDALRKYLGELYPLAFLTDWTIILAFGVGLFSFIGYQNKNFKSTLFCLLTFLVFNIFALIKFKWEMTTIEKYSSYKTLSCHLVFPIIAFLLMWWVRKDVLITIKSAAYCSLFLTIYYLFAITLYYSISYINNNGELTNLKIYDFLDFNNKVIIFNTNSISPRWIWNIIIVLISPLASLGIFLVFKFIYNVKIDKMYFEKQLSF